MENGHLERRSNKPIAFPRTRRPDFRALKTSARAGKVMPAAAFPVQPEDAILSGSSVQLTVQMEPTAKMLANAVHVRAHAYFVSYAALDRFEGMDSVAYGWAEKAGASAIVDNVTFARATHAEFYDAMGLHIAEGDSINTLYHRAYNQILNYRRQVVSESLPVRLETDATLARSLWGQTALARIVPDFDAALIEASAGLTFNAGTIPLSGNTTVDVDNVYRKQNGVVNTVYDSDGNASNKYEDEMVVQTNGSSRTNGFVSPSVDLSAITADMTSLSGTISLAEIEQAKQLKSFAQLRAKMAGTDEDLIDLLMQGISIPSALYEQPILIGQSSGIIGQAPRYASDSANLEDFIAEGGAQLRIPLNLPKQTTGGCVIVTYEIIPEPVFDRQADMFLYKTKAQMPNALRDYLDTQQVDVVPNRFVDALHTTPVGTFGYAPMNYDWARRSVAVGGRFLRELADTATDEDQQHIWSVRTVDPVLDVDAFLVPDALAHNVFRDTTVDTFFVRCDHSATIEGLTQFGPALYESTGEYDAVAAYAPTTKIVPPSEA